MQQIMRWLTAVSTGGFLLMYSSAAKLSRAHGRQFPGGQVRNSRARAIVS
jgi:hypothetical protein